MSLMRICLVALGILMLHGLVVAAEVQPTAQDWKDLLSRAKSTKVQYSDLLENTRMVLEARKKAKNTPEMRSPDDERPTIKTLEELLLLGQKADKELDGIIAALPAMKETDRTCDKYLALLHQVKGIKSQLSVYYVQLNGNQAAEEEKYAVQSIESKLKRLTKTPPERIPVAPLPKGLQLSWQDFPRMDGSTTAQPLSTLIACRMLGLGAEWHTRWLEDPRNADGTSERILVPACGEAPVLYDGVARDGAGFPGLRVNIVHSGTHTAYRNLILGVSNFIIVARPPSPDELALAKEKGVELDLRPIGYDAFVFLLNGKNPVKSLTVKQIQAIYQDNVLRWTELGGLDEKVIAYQRERNSGSQETMESLVMKGLKMAPPDEKMIGYGMGGPYNLLESRRNGIGYTFYYYHTVQSPETPAFIEKGQPPVPRLKICAVNGILPTPDTIGNRTYPFVTEVYAIIRKGEANDSPATRLRDWLLTPEGQALVKESGYVPAP